MADNFIIDKNKTKSLQYSDTLEQLEYLVDGEQNLIANLSNIMSALKYGFNFFWVGVYFVENEQLVLGPFQGPIACTRIQKGRGVCGTAWQEKTTLVVPNVAEFPGHIACSSASKSEIVIPVFNENNEVALILDVDSEQLDSFDHDDKTGLEAIAKLITRLIS